jgi:hypothetical protein
MLYKGSTEGWSGPLSRGFLFDFGTQRTIFGTNRTIRYHSKAEL